MDETRPEAVVIRRNGLTMLEVLLSIIIIAISAVIFLAWQKTSWYQTNRSNRMMVAGHVIEKQIEQRRMLIAQKPELNYAAFAALAETTITDSTTRPPVTVRWVMSSINDPTGVAVQHVRKVDLTARWGSGSSDSLRVSTCISKDF
jgi:prepilin-type N-terminal cleavage/methylation domain-containing protein